MHSSKGLSTAIKAVITSGAILLSGCSALNHDATDEIAKYKKQMQPKLEQSERPAPEKDIKAVSFSNDYWLGGKSYIARRGDPIPDIDIGVVSHVPITLHDLAGLITDNTKIATYVDTSGPDGDTGDDANGEEGVLYANDSTAQADPLAGLAPPPSDNEEEAVGSEPYPVNYEGPLQGLLDFATARWSVDAEYVDGRIRFYKYATRIFQFEVLPGESSMSTDMGMDTGSESDSETGGSNSAISQKVSSKFEMDGWAGIEEGLSSIVPEGSRYSMNRYTGTITVTAPNWAMRRVEDFINTQNKIMRRMVTLSINIMTVTLDEADRFGLDLEAAFNNSASIGLGLASPGTTTFENAGSLSANILSGGLAGTEAIVRALSSRGNVAMIDEAAVTVMNNTVGPINMLRQTGYLKSSGTTTSGDSTTTSLEQGTTTTGLSIAFLPRVFEDGRVLLNASINIAALRNLDTVRSGDAEIQTPDIDVRGFQQVASIMSGQTMVLTGLGRYSVRRDQEGTGSPEIILLGGSDQAERNRTQIIITITPRVLASPRVSTRLN